MEITPFLDRKLSRRFATFDSDGDGFIEQADFELSAARLGGEFGHKPDSPARQQVTELSLHLWQHLASVARVVSRSFRGVAQLAGGRLVIFGVSRR